MKRVFNWTYLVRSGARRKFSHGNGRFVGHQFLGRLRGLLQIDGIFGLLRIGASLSKAIVPKNIKINDL
jgi:hypothetical protein